MAMTIKHGCVMMLLSASIQISLSVQNDTLVGSEKQETDEVTTQLTSSTSEEPRIEHGCETVKRVQAGVRDCSYYCKYIRENNTWLYGFYEDGIYCWADDGDETKDRIVGLCYKGTCYPTDHDNVTHLSTPVDDTLGDISED
uniref:Evasin n=1 Tax=Rhipicephalus microplus TaxID=6941 RepID=A0A223FZ25_RHIMP|nr:evasin [Rhipicephalus microplus]